MTVLIALDSFKGSLSAREACDALAAGIRSVSSADVTCMPIADGGDGLIDCLSDTLLERGWQLTTTQALGPYGAEVKPRYLLKQSEAVIEMAEVCGLNLVEPEKRHTLRASSFGLGEVIADAVKHGARHITIGLGGSATNDLGLGCLQALGVQFFDAEGKLLPQPIKASDLAKIADLSAEAFKNEFGFLKVTAVCDVDNPLLGMNGATNVFAPQKGANAQELSEMEESMASAARVLSSYWGVDVGNRKGAGAAGGMGAALMWFFNASVFSGIEAVLDALEFNRILNNVRFVITGEGSFDSQSLSGKAPIGVLTRARGQKKSVTLVAGQVQCGTDELRQLGFDAAYELRSFAGSDADSMRRSREVLFEVGRRWAKDFKIPLI